MQYFVSYEMVCNGATAYWGHCLISPTSNEDILLLIEAIKNDSQPVSGGGLEIKVLCLTPLPR